MECVAACSTTYLGAVASSQQRRGDEHDSSSQHTNNSFATVGRVRAEVVWRTMINRFHFSTNIRSFRVLNISRVLAGPVAARALAAYGADVIRIAGPQGVPDVDALLHDTDRGQRILRLDLTSSDGRRDLETILRQVDVIIVGHSRSCWQRLGLDPVNVRRLNERCIHASLSAFDDDEWVRGFDSIIQAACGMNERERVHFNSALPRALPMQVSL